MGIHLFIVLLIIYCYITNYHKLSDLKHTFTILQFLRIKNLCSFLGPLLRVLQSCNQGIDQAWVLIGGLARERFASKLYGVVAEFIFLWL